MQVTVHAPAKINLTLDVIGVRADGYHLLESVMQSVDCVDTLTATATDGEVSLTVLGAPPCPMEKNTAYRAAQVFLREMGIAGGVAMTLTKRIPQQAGMGGGSADAAAALLALNALYDTRLSTEALCTMGLQVGADVPFCVLGGTAMVTGIGEGLKTLPALPDCHIVIAQPTDGVSTAAAYAALDNAPISQHPDNAAVANALSRGDLDGVCAGVFNVFEPATAIDGVTAIRRRMAEFSPLASQMTGSGSAVFAIFDNADKAQACADALGRDFPVAFTCRPCGGNAIIV
jgi:4-diphosphocytidyl-2-C-methyl-D-erythritol kinase